MHPITSKGLIDGLTAEESEKFSTAEEYLNRLFPDRRLNRVLLVTPPDGDQSIFRYDAAKRKRMSNFPPYGLMVVAEQLRKSDIDCEIVNLQHEILKACMSSESESDFFYDSVWKNKLDERIKEFEPDLIGVTCMFTMTHAALRGVCVYVSECFNTPIAIGGVHLSNDRDRILDDIPEAHFGFLNESEIAFQNFVEIVNHKKPISELSQVVFNEKDNRSFFLKEAQPTEQDIDIIPAFDLIPLAEYSSVGRVGPNYCFKDENAKFSTILSNRGCRAQCTFCSVRNFNGMGVRQRSIASVVDELEMFQDELGIDHFMWLDDDLLKDHKRAVGLFNEMVRRNLKMTWDASNGVIASSCTDEVIGAAAESGCIGLHIGMESGNPEILLQVKKPCTVDHYLRAAEIFKKYPQIYVHIFIIIGFPGETVSMIADTLRVSAEMDMDWYITSVLQPLPNTPVYEQMVSQGLIQEVGNKDTRYQVGSFGSMGEVENKRTDPTNIKELLSKLDADLVPSKAQLDDIWFYMDYHMNYYRIFEEDNLKKVDQQIKHLRKVSDILVPDHPLALYFLGYLQGKHFGGVKPEIIMRLERKLAESKYWSDRLETFDLFPEDLKKL
jgi:radical SAM superfamily enzyme YgiQ (UPF0313 family)